MVLYNTFGVISQSSNGNYTFYKYKGDKAIEYFNSKHHQNIIDFDVFTSDEFFVDSYNHVFLLEDGKTILVGSDIVCRFTQENKKSLDDYIMLKSAKVLTNIFISYIDFNDRRELVIIGLDDNGGLSIWIGSGFFKDQCPCNKNGEFSHPFHIICPDPIKNLRINQESLSLEILTNNKYYKYEFSQELHYYCSKVPDYDNNQIKLITDFSFFTDNYRNVVVGNDSLIILDYNQDLIKVSNNQVVKKYSSDVDKLFVYIHSYFYEECVFYSKQNKCYNLKGQEYAITNYVDYLGQKLVNSGNEYIIDIFAYTNRESLVILTSNNHLIFNESDSTSIIKDNDCVDKPFVVKLPKCVKKKLSLELVN